MIALSCIHNLNAEDFLIDNGDSKIQDSNVGSLKRGFHNWQYYIKLPNNSKFNEFYLNSSFGNFILKRTEFEFQDISFPFKFELFYNSGTDYKSTISNGWKHNFEIRYVKNNFNRNIIIILPDDKNIIFEYSKETDSYKSNYGNTDSLYKIGDSKYKLVIYNDEELNNGNYSEYFFDDESHHYVTKIVDLNKNTILFEYDNNKNLKKIIYPSARILNFNYSADKLISVDYEGFKTINFSYDKNNFLSRLLSNINSQEFKYDDNCFKLNEIIENSITNTKLAFDDLLRLKSYVMGDTIINIGIEYNNLSTNISLNNKKYAEIKYDNDFKFIQIFDFSNNAEQFKWNNNYQIIEKNDRNGFITKFQYDDLGKIKSIIDQENNSTIYNFEPKNKKLISLSENQKTIFEYNYDDFGNLTRIKNYGEILDFSYDINGFLTEVNQLDRNIKFKFDFLGNISLVSFNELSNFYFENDRYSNMIALIDANNNKYNYVYNFNNDIQYLNYPDNSSQKYIYNELGLLGTIVFPDNSDIKCKYDNIGRKTSIINQLNNEFKFSYLSFDSIKISMSELDLCHINFQPNTLLASLILSNSMDYIASYDKNYNLKSEKKLDNSKLEYEYDKLNRLISISDVNNRFLRFSYIFPNYLKSIIKPNNEIINFIYEDNYLVKISQSLNNEFSFEYDVYGNLTKIIDPNFNQYNYKWSLHGKNTGIILPDNSSLEFVFDLNGNLISEKLRNNQVISYKYNSRNLISEKNEANTNYYNYLYNANKRLLKVVDKFDRQSLYSYNKAGNLINFQSFNNMNYIFDYNKLNSVSNIKINNQKNYNFNSDILGNINSISLPSGAIFEYQYTNNKLSSISNKQAEIKILYDRINRPTNFIDAYNKILSFQYDNSSLINKIILPNLSYYDLNYNGLGSLVNIKKPEGNILSYFYDNNQNLIRFFNDEKLIANLKYNQLNKLSRIITSTQDTAEYEYNQFGLISSFKDFANLKTNYTYSAKNNLIRIDNGISKLIEYNEFNLPSSVSIDGIPSIKLDYENNENLKSVSFADTKIELDYDTFHNINNFKINDIDLYSISYNPSNQVVEIKDKYGANSKYNYDLYGNLISIINAENKAVSYQYNLMGKPEIYFDFKERPSRYFYNSNGLISSFINREQIQTDYSYNKNDNLSVIKFNRTDSIKLQYNSSDFIKSISYPNDNKYTYEFDNSGRILKIQTEDNEINRFIYSANSSNFTFISPKNDTTIYLYDKYSRLIIIRKNHNYNKIIKLNNIGLIYEELNGKYLMKKNIFDSNLRLTYNFNIFEDTKQYNYNTNFEINRIYFDNYYYDIQKNQKQVSFVNSVDSIIYNNSLTNNINSIDKNKFNFTFTYDDDFGLKSVKKNTNIQYQISTDNEGRINHLLLPNKNAFSFNYDGRCNIRKMTPPFSNSLNYSYDRNSNLLLFEDEHQDRFNYGFDLNNRIISFSGKSDKKRNFKYDKNWNTNNIIENHQLISRIESNYDFLNRIDDLSIYFSNFSRRNVRFNYNEVNHLSSLKFNDIDSVKYLYDNIGNIETVIGYKNDTITFNNSKDNLNKTINFPNGFKEINYYNTKGLVRNYKLVSKDGTIIIDIEYQYNIFDNLEKITINNDSVIIYNYNDLQQISKIINGNDTVAFYYDNIGNPLRQVHNNQSIDLLYSIDNKLLNYGDIDYTWDIHGNVLSRSDANSIVQFYYDDENRLSQAVYNDTLKYNFYYSGKNNLIKISSNIDEYYLPIDFEDNSKFNAVLEFDKNVNLSRRYVYYAKKENWDLLYYYDISNNQTNFVHQDPFSFFIFKSEMNEKYQLLNSFDLFGNPNYLSDKSMRFGFNGMTFIKELNLYYVEGRFYDPKTGIFLQKNQNLFETTDNLYRFKNNNPLHNSKKNKNNYELFIDDSYTQQTLNPFDNKYLNLNSKKIVHNLLDTLFDRQFNLFKNFNINYAYNVFDFSGIIDEHFSPDRILNLFQSNAIDEFIDFNRLEFYPKLPQELLIDELQDKFNNPLIQDISIPTISKTDKIQKIIEMMKLTDLPEDNVFISYLEKLNKLLNLNSFKFNNILEIKLPEPDIKFINSILQSGNNFNKLMKLNYKNNRVKSKSPLEFFKSISNLHTNKSEFAKDNQLNILKPFIQSYHPKINLLNNLDFDLLLPEIDAVETSNFIRIIDLLNNSLDNSINITKILYDNPKIILPYSFNFLNNLNNYPISPKIYNLELNQINPPKISE